MDKGSAFRCGYQWLNNGLITPGFYHVNDSKELPSLKEGSMAVLYRSNIHSPKLLVLAGSLAFGLFNIALWNGLSPVRGEDAPQLQGKIAFVSDGDGDTDVFVMAADTGMAMKLFDTPYQERWPSFSPDRQRVVFTRITTQPPDDAHGDLYVFSPATQELDRLTHDGDAHQPAWSPLGEQIAFDAFANGLQMIRPDGSGRRLAVSDTLADRPGWAPNGQDIVYHLLNPSTFQTRGLFLYDGFLLFSKQVFEFGVDPAVSPDGGKVAFVSNQNGNVDIFVVNMDGTGLRNLTDSSSAVEAQPVWSPDGKFIAFTTNRDGNQEIYVMNADGTNPVNISNLPESNESDPDWK